MTLYRFFQAGSIFLGVLRLAVLLDWFLRLFRLRNRLVDWLEAFISPFLSPYRKLAQWLVRRTGIRLDFTYFFALIGMSVVDRLWWLLYSFFRTIR